MLTFCQPNAQQAASVARPAFLLVGANPALLPSLDTRSARPAHLRHVSAVSALLEGVLLCRAPCLFCFALFLQPRAHPAPHLHAVWCRHVSHSHGAAKKRAWLEHARVRRGAFARASPLVVSAGRPHTYALSRPPPSPHTHTLHPWRAPSRRPGAWKAVNKALALADVPRLAASPRAARRPASSWPPRLRASRRPPPEA